MKLIATFLFIVLTTYIQAQDFTKPFLRKNFPSDKYQVQYKSYSFQKLTIEFVLVKRLPSNGGSDDECNIYLNVVRDKKVIRGKYLGSVYTEGAICIPKVQPLDKYFMINIYYEWNGEINLIDTTGQIIKFPSYYWALSKDKKYIFTKASYPDYDSEATKFDVDSAKFSTKTWHLTRQGEPWKEVLKSEYNEPGEQEITFCR